MKKIISLLLAVGLAMSLAGCNASAENPETTAAPATTAEATAAVTTAVEESTGAVTDGEKLRIGYACPNINNTFQTYLMEAAQAYANANDIELLVVDGQQDVVMQQDQVKSLIQQGVDALIVSPADTSAMEPLTQAARDANIPLIYLNSNPYAGKESEMPEGVYYVGSQEVTAGELQMQYAGEKMSGKGNVCILMGGLTYEASFQRTEGVKNIIASTYPDIKVLAEETGDWQRDKALAVTENWLTAYGDDIDAIFANNDEMALGAIQCLNTLGIKDVMVFGIDATPDAVKAVEEGTMTGTVFQDAVGQAEGAMQLAVKAAGSETIAEQVLWIPFILVTPENYTQYK